MADKGVQVNATVPKEWDALLEDHKWKVKKTKTQLVRAAVEEYMINHDLLARDDSGQLHPTYTPEASDETA